MFESNLRGGKRMKDNTAKSTNVVVICVAVSIAIMFIAVNSIVFMINS